MVWYGISWELNPYKLIPQINTLPIKLDIQQ